MSRPQCGCGICKACYMRWRSRQKEAGKWETATLYTEAAPVREHVLALRQARVGLRRITDLSGVPRRTIFELCRRDPGMITKVTAAALMAVPKPTKPHDPIVFDGTFIPALGTQRRLQALVVGGYSGRWLSSKMGKSECYLNPVINGARTKVTARMAREVDALFCELQMIPGPSGRARGLGKQRGYVPAFAWDEAAIDDPDEQPDLGADTKLSFPERYLELREHVGLNDQQIADAMGIELDSLERQLYRYDMFKGRAA